MLSGRFAVWHYDLVSACLLAGRGGVEVPSFEIFFFSHGSWDLHYYGIERGGWVKGRKEILHMENETSLRIKFVTSFVRFL